MLQLLQKVFKHVFLIMALVVSTSASVWAQEPPKPSSMNNPFVMFMVTIIALLALIIGVLAYVVLNAAQVKLTKDKEEEAKSQSFTGIALTLIVMFFSSSLFAQGAAESAPAVASAVSDTAYYTLVSVAFLEIVTILTLLFMLKSLIAIQKPVVEVAEVSAKPVISWWDKLNKFKPIQQEADIDLGHNYDGIRELDNRLPPWWLYGFYCCIIFAVIYLWRFHVSGEGQLSKEEYLTSVAEAEVAKAAYLEKAANSVDESTVKLLTDETSLAAGKKNFQAVCAACHTATGGGNVGPNLTDDYWLHGGSIQEVFKTIKYGWTDKGMKSWKDDFSPIQIAQLSSYVKSLHGTNPPNPKAPQGVLVQESAAATPAKADSSSPAPKDSSAAATTAVKK